MKQVVLLIVSVLLSVFEQQSLPVLTEKMLNKSNGVFVVKKNYSLKGKALEIPKGVTLVFDGGSLDHGELIGHDTSIEVRQSKPAFGLDVEISGKWNAPLVKDGWFEFDESNSFISNRLINNMLSF